jgi:hypothetical protein
VGWDAIAAVPGQVLFVDPLMLTLLPGIKEATLKLVKNKVIAGVVYNISDISSRVSISAKKTKLFQEFEKAFVPTEKSKEPKK